MIVRIFYVARHGSGSSVKGLLSVWLDEDIQSVTVVFLEAEVFMTNVQMI